MKKPGKIEIISLMIFVLLQSIVFFYWGDSVRPYIKHVFIKTFSFAATTTNARLVERMVFQGIYSIPAGERSRIYLPEYNLIDLYEFNVGDQTIQSIDDGNVFNDHPAEAIAKAFKKFGSGPVAFHILDTASRRSAGLPWFMMAREFSDTSKTDSAFASLMREGGFVAKPINRKVTYLRFAPHYNSLEALPLNKFYSSKILWLLPILMAAALIFQLWHLVIRKELGYSVLTSVGSWVAVLILIFIVAPVRPPDVALKRKEYKLHLVVDQAFAEKKLSELANSKNSRTP